MNAYCVLPKKLQINYSKLKTLSTVNRVFWVVRVFCKNNTSENFMEMYFHCRSAIQCRVSTFLRTQHWYPWGRDRDNVTSRTLVWCLYNWLRISQFFTHNYGTIWILKRDHQLWIRGCSSNLPRYIPISGSYNLYFPKFNSWSDI